MLSIISKLEHVVAGEVITLLCGPQTPLPALKEALFQFTRFVGQVEEQAAAAQRQAEAQKAAEGQSTPVVPPLPEQVL